MTLRFIAFLLAALAAYLVPAAQQHGWTHVVISPEQLAKEKAERQRPCAEARFRGVGRVRAERRVKAERRVALVIGNSNYGDGPHRITTPANDASMLAEALRIKGFDVMLITNASHEQMQHASSHFKEKVRQSDVALFYFAGYAAHGFGRNLLFPVDADLSIPNDDVEVLMGEIDHETVELDDFLGGMIEDEEGTNIIILDGNRPNSLIPPSQHVAGGMAELEWWEIPHDGFVWLPARPGKVVSDGGEANSLFMATMVKHLTEATATIRIDDLFNQVARDVAQETNGQQNPWNRSKLERDFCFKGP